jgi:hypothetical protein
MMVRELKRVHEKKGRELCSRKRAKKLEKDKEA